MCMKFGKEKWLSSLTLEEAGKILDISKLIGWWVFGVEDKRSSRIRIWTERNVVF